MSNSLKDKLAAGGCITCHWATLGSPSVAEVLAESGPDSIVFDMQHGLWDRSSLEHAIGLVRHRTVPVVRSAEPVETFQKIYGKRIIIMGGGAQVGQVALGAITEADRHNIRGEHISVDTIPLVGEENLAAAVRATARLPRVRALVLAGALMGGDIERAVREVRAKGLLVISLNMAGSVPQAADLVVSDPVQAGVMAVMAIADTATFSVARLKNRVF